MAQAPVGDAGPQDGMHLGHVRAPQHEGIGGFEIVIAAHRLVHAKGAHEALHRGGHAVARIGVEVVRAEACLEQLGCGIAFPYGPLARAEHAHRGGAFFLQHALELPLHLVKGALPRDRREVAVLVVLAVLHAQQRLGQAVLAVHDLRQEIALDAVQPLVDLGLRVAIRGHDLVVPDRHRDAAAGAAEAARRLGPFQLCHLAVRDKVGGPGRQRDAGH
ncbi:hypothetical protein D3C72_1524050 [compost metagenome]